MTLIFFLILILLLVFNNQLVLTGASYGLMLWYENVLPLLLPFMLISGLIENSVINNTFTKNHQSKVNSKSLPIITVLALGLFCGYPIGAKTNAFFTKGKIINPKIGNIILPICNNISPMFLMGFILSRILQGHISPVIAYVCIYAPYILVLAIELLCYRPNHKATEIKPLPTKENPQSNSPTKRSITQQSIEQITHVGLYIMLCSIFIEFILNFNYISPGIKLLLTGATEITRGASYIATSGIINQQIKTALILACTSFGGISSIMQTSKVIQDSGLSLLHYISVKMLCAIGTFFLFLLIV